MYLRLIGYELPLVNTEALHQTAQPTTTGQPANTLLYWPQPRWSGSTKSGRPRFSLVPPTRDIGQAAKSSSEDDKQKCGNDSHRSDDYHVSHRLLLNTSGDDLAQEVYTRLLGSTRLNGKTTKSLKDRGKAHRSSRADSQNSPVGSPERCGRTAGKIQRHSA